MTPNYFNPVFVIPVVIDVMLFVALCMLINRIKIEKREEE